MSTKPRVWPENANNAREDAIEAAALTIDALIDATACLVRNDIEGALEKFKYAIRLQHYIEKTLEGAKHGEASGAIPKEGGEAGKRGIKEKK